MITLATLPSLNDAFLLRSMLEASEIPAFIPDENTCQVDWGYINAIGGVRVQVPNEFEEDARSVLADFNDKSNRDTAPTSSPHSDSLVKSNFVETHQATTKEEHDARLEHSSKGGLLLVLLALALVAGCLFLLQHGQIEATALTEGNKANDKGDYDLAITKYSRGIEFNPKNDVLYFARANAYAAKAEQSKTGADYDHAIADYNRAIEIDPHDANAYVRRGMVQDDRGEYDKAIQDYTQALLMDPRNEYAALDRGKAYSDKGEGEKAFADFNEAIRLDPSDTQAYFNRGDVYTDRKEYDKAIADFSTVIQIDPRNGNAYNNRGNVFDAQGEYTKALADYYVATQVDFQNTNALDSLAWDLATCQQADLRDGKKAVGFATKACELSGWKDSTALDTLAAACAEAGDFESAVKWESKGLEILNPSSKDIADYKKRLVLYQAHKAYHAEK
jgi:tetratricopeptide (TPR) repeat protein